jgi:hypothetical protein
VLAPHGQVALRHAGVGGQDEQDGVGVGQQGEREFGFRADGVQARRIENHQSLFEQRVGKLDDGVAPAGISSEPSESGLHAVIALCVDRQSPVLRLPGWPRGFRRPGQGGCRLSVELVSRSANAATSSGKRLSSAMLALVLRVSIGSRRISEACRLLPLQLGRAHGGAPGAGGQDAVAVAGEEDGVDELGLAARELGHEGDDQLVFAQAVEQVLQAQIDCASPISLSCSHLRSSPIPEATSPRHWV